MGIAMPLSIPANYLMEKFLKTGHTEVAHAIDEKAVKGILCSKVKTLLYYEVGDVAWEYVKTHPSSIGTSCYRNEEMVCATWLKNYYKWLVDRVLDELPSVEDLPDVIPDIPQIPGVPSIPSFPDMPDAGDVKRSLQVTGLVIIGVILIIVYMLTGRGKKGVTVVT